MSEIIYGRTKAGNWNKRDDLMVLALSKFGYLRKQDLKELTKVGALGIGDKRLKQHTKAHFIKSKKVVIGGKTEVVYYLSDRAQKYAKGQCLTVYKSHLKHDIAHSMHIVATYDRKDVIEHYVSEKELMKADARNGESRVDGAFIREGEVELVETITKSYSKDKRDAKDKYASTYAKASDKIVKFSKYHSKY